MDTFTTTNLKKFFTYPFEDEKWQNKLLIVGGLMLAGFIIPIIPYMALGGYMMRIIKKVVEGDGKPSLPEWDDWGELMLNGLKLLLQSFIFALPLIILWFVGYGSMFFPIVLSELAAESGDMGSAGLWTMISLLTIGGGYIMFGLVILFSFVLGFIQSVIICHVSVTEQFSAAFRFREWWRILRSNIGEFLLACVFIMGLYIGIGTIYQVLMFTIVLCCILPIVLSAASGYLMLVMAPLFGSVYRTALEKVEA
jgi:Protein of unknown function (DUF4013)